MKCDNFSEVEAMRVKINYLMNGLKDVEKAVICGLFGFGCEEVSAYTLSKKFNLTEERIRQIKFEALEKMAKLG
jgi:DNA-directed RNA polymerase sigma subunit (sigma70/sigma32)